MRVRRFDDAPAFLARASAYLGRHEAEHNLLFGLGAELSRNPLTWGSPPYLALVESGDEVLVAAVITPPHAPTLSRCADPAALELLARDVAAWHVGPLPGVSGPSEVAAGFARIWEALSGARATRARALRIYELTTVRRPAGVPGALRPAGPGDRALLVEWNLGFQRDVGHAGERADAERAVERWLTTAERRLVLWCDAQPVAMAGALGPTPHGIRIGAVYTPPELRRRGYASACVAELSQQMLDQGRRFCFLYTDLANPTSNHIYQQIGYAPIADADEYTFAPASAAQP